MYTCIYTSEGEFLDLTLYLVNDLVVGSGQNHIHGVHEPVEWIDRRVSAVSRLTLDLRTNSCQINSQGAYRHPWKSFPISVVFSLVFILKKGKDEIAKMLIHFFYEL